MGNRRRVYSLYDRRGDTRSTTVQTKGVKVEGTWEKSALFQEGKKWTTGWGQTRVPSGQPPNTASQNLAIIKGCKNKQKNLNITHIVQISASNEENTILLFPEFSKTVFKIISKNRFMSKYVDKLPSHTPSYREGRKWEAVIHAGATVLDKCQEQSA